MKYLTNLIIGIVLLAFLAWNPTPLQILELKTFDWLMASKETVQDNMVLLVDLDEEIVEAYGGYPLPRSLYATLINKTQGTAGITVLMPDPDVRGAVEDAILAKTLMDNPAVLAYTASNQATKVGPHVGTAQLGGDPKEWLLNYPGILRQQHNAVGVGLINASPELDGVVRRLPLVVSSGNKLFPSFALEMLRVGVGDPSYQISTKETGVEWIRIPSFPLIKTDSNSRILPINQK